jgi:hypothetical protein
MLLHGRLRKSQLGSNNRSLPAGEALTAPLIPMLSARSGGNQAKNAGGESIS